MEPDPENPKKLGPRRNWGPIRAQFIEGEADPETGQIVWPESLKELAAGFGVPYDTIKKKARQEKWVDKQKAYQDKVEETRRAEQLKIRLQKMKDFEESCFGISEQGIIHLKLHLNKFAKNNRGVENPNPIALKELDILARTTEKLQKIGCVALGIPDSTTVITPKPTNDAPFEFRWRKE